MKLADVATLDQCLTKALKVITVNLPLNFFLKSKHVQTSVL